MADVDRYEFQVVRSGKKFPRGEYPEYAQLVRDSITTEFAERYPKGIATTPAGQLSISAQQFALRYMWLGHRASDYHSRLVNQRIILAHDHSTHQLAGALEVANLAGASSLVTGESGIKARATAVLDPRRALWIGMCFLSDEARSEATRTSSAGLTVVDGLVAGAISGVRPEHPVVALPYTEQTDWRISLERLGFSEGRHVEVTLYNTASDQDCIHGDVWTAPSVGAVTAAIVTKHTAATI